MIKVENIEDAQKRVTLTCEIHSDISFMADVCGVGAAYDKAKGWSFVGQQVFCPSCNDSKVLQSFTSIGGILLRRRRDLKRLRARIDAMQEQIDMIPAESTVMTLAYDRSTARLDKSERIMLDVLVTQLIADANNA